MKARVVAVDVGSVARGRYAWCALDLPSLRVAGTGTDPEQTVESLIAGLDEQLPVALGFEAPLLLPVPLATAGASTSLGRARSGEGNRSWSAGAGAGALATGLVQISWVLDRLVAVRGDDMPTVTTTPATWMAGRADVLLWEAFVSGDGKPVPAEAGSHAADAAAAAEEFGERLAHDRLIGDVTVAGCTGFNLAACAAQRAGLALVDSDLRSEVLVIRTQGGA